MKQAASRPRPPLPRPASGSVLGEPGQSSPSRSSSFLDERLDQQVGDVVGERAADQELHREVIDPLGVLAVVGLLRLEPALA